MVAPPRIGTRIVPDRPLGRGDSVTSVAAARTKKATFTVWHQPRHRLEEGLNGVPRYETCPQSKALISTERRAEVIRMVPSSQPYLATDGMPAEVSQVTKVTTDRAPDIASGDLVSLCINPRSMTVQGIDEREDTQALGCARLWWLVTLRRGHPMSMSRNARGRYLLSPSLRIVRRTRPSGAGVVVRISGRAWVT